MLLVLLIKNYTFQFVKILSTVLYYVCTDLCLYGLIIYECSSVTFLTFQSGSSHKNSIGLRSGQYGGHLIVFVTNCIQVLLNNFYKFKVFNYESNRTTDRRTKEVGLCQKFNFKLCISLIGVLRNDGK